MVKSKLLNGRVCFNVEETTSKKGLILKERIYREQIFPLTAAPMRKDNTDI